MSVYIIFNNVGRKRTGDRHTLRNSVILLREALSIKRREVNFPFRIKRYRSGHQKCRANRIGNARSVGLCIPTSKLIARSVKHAGRKSNPVVLFGGPRLRRREHTIIRIERKVNSQRRIDVTRNQFNVAVHLNSIARIVGSTSAIDLPSHKYLTGKSKLSTLYRRRRPQSIGIAVHWNGTLACALIISYGKSTRFPLSIEIHITRNRGFPAIGNKTIGSWQIPVPTKEFTQTIVGLPNNIRARILHERSLRYALREQRSCVTFMGIEIRTILRRLPFAVKLNITAGHNCRGKIVGYLVTGVEIPTLEHVVWTNGISRSIA